MTRPTAIAFPRVMARSCAIAFLHPGTRGHAATHS